MTEEKSENIMADEQPVENTEIVEAVDEPMSNEEALELLGIILSSGQVDGSVISDPDLLSQMAELFMSEMPDDFPGAVKSFDGALKSIGLNIGEMAETGLFMRTMTTVFPLPEEDAELMAECAAMVNEIKDANDRVNEKLDSDLDVGSRTNIVPAEESPFGVSSIIIGKAGLSAEEKIRILGGIKDWGSVVRYLQLYAPQCVEGEMKSAPVAFVFDPEGNEELAELIAETVIPTILAEIPEFFAFPKDGKFCIGSGFVLKTEEPAVCDQNQA
jgi:hypothetical protein